MMRTWGNGLAGGEATKGVIGMLIILGLFGLLAFAHGPERKASTKAELRRRRAA